MNKHPIPPEMEKTNTCFFTGHRILTCEDTLYPHLVRSILRLAENGYRYFISGGALGFDLLAAQTVIALQTQYGKEVQLVLALPCRDQTARWDTKQKLTMEALRTYHAVKQYAHGVVYMHDFYVDGCMRERNRFMVEHASRCIACWDGSFRGGTAQTVRMAQKEGVPVLNLYPAAAGSGKVQEI